MASLRAGVLLKLLRNMVSSADDFPTVDLFSDGDCSAVLQVTGIIPSLAGSDLFPDRGFYLQVSDSSHSTYVSLPPGNDDLILSDSLRLGQLIHVRRLESSSPVPVLHGLRLLPDPHPFPNDTIAIVAPMPATCLTKFPFMDPSFTESKKRQPRSENLLRAEGRKNSSASPARRQEKVRASPALSHLSKIGVNHIDEENNDWDASSVITSTPSSSSYSFSPLFPREKTLRKNWQPSDRTNSRKQETKPVVRTRSATFTQGDFARSYVSKDDVLEDQWTRKRDCDAGLKALSNNSTKRKLSTSSKTSTKNYAAAIPFSIYDETKWPESNVLWGSLSLNLVKHGKEVLSQRDTALYTALDSLQEACALEGLIRCLSTYSELKANKKYDPQYVVDLFLNFHQDLSSATLTAQSLARPGTSLTQTMSASTVEAAKVALDRRACAASWIKAALESELSRTPRKSNIGTDHAEVSTPDRKFQSSLNRQRKCTDTVPKGSCSLMAADLAKALLSECNRWFLRYIEKFLDLVHSNRNYTSNESQIATLLCQLKRVNDWLVTIPTKDKYWLIDRSKESTLLEDDGEACGRVRRKIYEFFLRHVESAAMALDSMLTTDDDKAVAL